MGCLITENARGEELLQDPRLFVTRADQCQFGLLTPLVGGTDGYGHALKPTGFMSNPWCVMEELSGRCGGFHTHTPLVGGRGKDAAIYPKRALRISM